MIEKRKRPRSADRKEQILTETLDLIMNHGLAGATMTRIAAKVGISEPALYRHFKNRKELMLAALDAAFRRLMTGINFEAEDAATYLRNVSTLVHGEFTSNPQLSRVLFEFICAPPAEELREPIVQYILMLLQLFEYRLGQGVQQGLFREDLDLQLTAWESFSLGFTLSFVSLLGLQEMLPADKARSAIENVIERISAPQKPKHPPRKPAPASRSRLTKKG